MEYTAVYEPNTLASGVLDLQLLMRLIENRVPVEQLLQGTGISHQQLSSPNAHISLPQKLSIFSNALDQEQEPGLGLQVGSQARFSDFGVLGYAVFSSNTLLDALLMGFKYLRLAGPVLRKKMWVEDNLGYFRADELIENKDLLPFCSEYWFSAILRLCEEVLQAPFPSIAIYFPYPKPKYHALYQEVFKCPVYFDSPHLEWQFNAQSLYQPLPTANTATLQLCLKSCEQVLEQFSGQTQLIDTVTQMLLTSPKKMMNIETVAERLNMSSRTLRRHLAADNTSYQTLLDHVRFELSRQYLLSTQMKIEDISEIIGFTDSANFRHAFKRWSGNSPSQYRKQHSQSRY